MNSLEALHSNLETDDHRNQKGIVILCEGKRVSQVYFDGDSAEVLHGIRRPQRASQPPSWALRSRKG